VTAVKTGSECFNCDQNGHWAKDCDKPLKDRPFTIARMSDGGGRGSYGQSRGGGGRGGKGFNGGGGRGGGAKRTTGPPRIQAGYHSIGPAPSGHRVEGNVANDRGVWLRGKQSAHGGWARHRAAELGRNPAARRGDGAAPRRRHDRGDRHDRRNKRFELPRAR
jgi:hypothetical protein